MSIVPPLVSEDAKAEMQRLAAERYAPAPAHKQPVEFSHAIANAICERLIEGESLRSICRDDTMPSKAAVLKWAANHDERPELVGFVDQYARAMMLSGDADHDDIADMGRQIARGELDPAAGRVAIDAFKWTSGRKNPKKYGDRVGVDHNVTGDLHAWLVAAQAKGEPEKS